jgi:molybdopterin-guanine dinucleotide biosynthesis protein A
LTTFEVSAIVLAGGRSSRFGRDKLAERIGGRTLLEHAIEAVGPIASETIVVLGAGDRRDMPRGVTVVRDALPFEGPLAGLLTGLGAATQAAALLVAGDMPTMVTFVLSALIDSLENPKFDAVLLDDGGRGRPLPAAIRVRPATVAAIRMLAAGERRLRALYDEMPTMVIGETTWRELDPDGLTLRDVDLPGDMP